MDLDKIKILTFANNRYLGSRENLIRHLSSLGLNNFIKLDESYFSEDFVKENQKILSMRRGFGYWLWKPYIIIEELKKLQPDEILLYLDSGDKPEKLLFDIINNHMLQNDNLFVNRGYKNGDWTKKDCFTLMNCDDEKYYNSVQLEAGIICLKNTDSNMDLLDDWFFYCKNEQILTDSPNKFNEKNLDGFMDHRHDQSVLTNVVLKRNIKSFKFTNDIIKYNYY
jgi:hypothetical protein